MIKKLVFLLFVSFLQEIVAQQSPEFLYDRFSVSIVGHDIKGELKVYRGDFTLEEVSSQVEIFGYLDTVEIGLLFTPLLDFDLSQTYTCLYNNQVFVFHIDLPKDYDRLEIEEIFPTLPYLPANLLKLYIQFNKPLNETNVYDKIFLLDAQEQVLERAFLPLENALLNEDGTLLTIWLEPGRQKRGLGPNDLLGPVLTEGEDYILLISKDISDKHGISMTSDYKRRMNVVSDDRERPKLSKWKINLPKYGSKEFLEIQFKEVMDYGSSLKAISIKNSLNIELEGVWQIGRNERSMVFKPVTSWKKGDFVISVYPGIEDLAGNNLERLFDQKIGQNKTNRNETFELIFTIE